MEVAYSEEACTILLYYSSSVASGKYPWVDTNCIVLQSSQRRRQRAWQELQEEGYEGEEKASRIEHQFTDSCLEAVWRRGENAVWHGG